MRAFIKINFDANLLTIDLPTLKLNLGVDSNGLSENAIKKRRDQRGPLSKIQIIDKMEECK